MMKTNLMLFGALAALGWLPAKAQLTSCPTSDIQSTTSSCYELTPAAAGADPNGVNATVASLILTPSSSVTPRGQLLLYLNGSDAHPDGLIATPTQNFYLAATGLGYNVIALSYSSEQLLTNVCSGVATCFYPSRQTIITGVYQSGAASVLADILPSEGIVARLTMTLQTLAQDYPSQGWSNFLIPATRSGTPTINWSKVVASGQSQGGGNAAALGKMFPLAGVIQLSGTCDQTHANEENEAAAVPAPWLFAPTGGSSGWATDPHTFWGLDAATYFGADGYAQCPEDEPQCGDEICFSHLKGWQAEGMVASHQIDNEYICPPNITTDQVEIAVELNVHNMSIQCVENYPIWLQMLQ